MEFGEAGVDYVMFGEPRADGSLPPLEAVIERAAWWAEIFQTPCIAYAPTLEAVSDLVRTGAEFIGVGEAVWSHSEGPAAAVAAALERCATEAAR
jgi:thiamine-phosphate pyrophosphorylase